MGFRGIIRDILIFYLAYEIFSNSAKGKNLLSTYGYLALVLILILTIWFELEKMGIFEKKL